MTSPEATGQEGRAAYALAQARMQAEQATLVAGAERIELASREAMTSPPTPQDGEGLTECGNCALLSAETPCPRCGWTTRPDGELVPPTAEDLCPYTPPCPRCVDFASRPSVAKSVAKS